jgi:hypothetical protein
MNNKAFCRTLCAIGIGILAFEPSSDLAKPKPPKMVVQLYAQVVSSGITQSVDVYVVLPDGSRAVGHCFWSMGGSPCVVDPFAPEKRVVQNCIPPDRQFQAQCITSEIYYADRKINDLTLYAANGKVTYHITGSWTEFTLGRVPPSKGPTVKAVCQDGTYSFSEQNSGTCSDHGGVYRWINPH